MEVPFSRMTLEELAAYLENRGRLSPEEKRLLQSDRRRGARLLLERCLRREEMEKREEQRLHNLLREESFFYLQGVRHIAGVDEAGRGPLAGPVVAAAVILPPGAAIRHLNDSKQLAESRREELYERIQEVALGCAVGICSTAEIDRLNIFGATMEAMRRALAALSPRPEVVLVDGFPIRELDLPQKAIPGGDALSLSIAAASVVAKVTRDRIMRDLHRRYPQYGFDRNKGYPTREHLKALARHGPCPEHRRSFRPCGGREGELS